MMEALGRRLPLLLLGGVALLLGGGSCRASSHSLRYLIWAVWEPGWRLPVSASSVYVDDQLIGRYDRNTDQCVPQSSWIKEIGRDDADFWARSTGWDLPSSLGADLMSLKNLFNRSRGMQTLQVFSGCELSGDDNTARGYVKYGYNGRDFLRLNLANLIWTAMDAEAKPIMRKWNVEQNRGKFWGHFLMDTCVKWLSTHLRYGKEALLRTHRPMVSLSTKFRSRLNHLATQLFGFYPKEVEVAWMKDGRDRNLNTRTGGIVPNSDGTYNTWVTLEVNPKETSRYSCRVRHMRFRALLTPPHTVLEEPEGVTSGQGVTSSQEVTSSQRVTSAVPVSKVGSLWGSSWASWLLVALVEAGVIFHIT